MTDDQVRPHPIPSADSDVLATEFNEPTGDVPAPFVHQVPPEGVGGDAAGGYTGMDNGETGEDTGYPTLHGEAGADGPAPDPAPHIDQLRAPPRDHAHPEPGDPPSAVRGARQALADPPGDAADDGTRRWDPRTQTTGQREGG